MGIGDLALLNIDGLLVSEGCPVKDLGGGLGGEGGLSENIMMLV
jgi:hypothetical protein